MRCYLAVIKDSFREAMASRVLWVLLALITLVLLGLAPFSFVEKAASQLRWADLRDGQALLATLKEQRNADEPSPARRVGTFLSADLWNAIEAVDLEESERPWSVIADLRVELNEILNRRDLYDATAWADVRLPEEARTLQQRGLDRLSRDELARFNRLLLEAAFPEEIAVSPKQAIYASYLGLTLSDESLPLQSSDVQYVIKQALTIFVGFFAGTVGVFVAILVTAPIMPRTLEPGAIDLLLSKPVSRSLLLLAKFLGGCAFILLNATYLIVGLWLIAGLRHGVWSNELLLCIPIYLFLFAIYYSVSTLAGVIWRGAVISIVMTILFWLLCTVVGGVKGFVETFYLNKSRLAVIVPADETLLATNKQGQTFQWNQQRNEWEEVFAGTNSSRTMPFVVTSPMIGPIYDSHSDRLYAMEAQTSRFVASSKLLVGERADHWRRRETVNVPGRVTSLFTDPDGELIAAGPSGIFRFEGDPSVERKPFKLFGIDLAPQNEAGAFVPIHKEPKVDWSTPFSAAMNRQDGSIAVFTDGRLLILGRDDEGSYDVRQQAELEIDGPALVAYSGDTVALALGTGEVRVFDAQVLTLQEEFTPLPDHKPRQIAASRDGRWFAAVYHNRYLWLYDARVQSPVEPAIPSQGDVQAVAFSSEDTLFVADRFRRVIEYDLESFEVQQRQEPESTWAELSYRHILNPLYTVFPKPGELDNMVAYLVTDTRSQPLMGEEDNLEAERVVFDIWEPIWSNVAFVAVMLTLTCLYMARKDF